MRRRDRRGALRACLVESALYAYAYGSSRNACRSIVPSEPSFSPFSPRINMPMACSTFRRGDATGYTAIPVRCETAWMAAASAGLTIASVSVPPSKATGKQA